MTSLRDVGGGVHCARLVELRRRLLHVGGVPRIPEFKHRREGARVSGRAREAAHKEERPVVKERRRMEGARCQELERNARIHPLCSCARNLEHLDARGRFGPRSARDQAPGNKEPAAADDVRRVKGARAVELHRAVRRLAGAALLRDQLEPAIVGVVPLDVSAQVAQRTGAVGGSANHIVALPAGSLRERCTRATGALCKLALTAGGVPGCRHRDGIEIVAVTDFIPGEEAVRRPGEDRDCAWHRLATHRHQRRTSEPDRAVAGNPLNAHPRIARKVDGGERERASRIGRVAARRIRQQRGAVVGLNGKV